MFFLNLVCNIEGASYDKTGQRPVSLALPGSKPRRGEINLLKQNHSKISFLEEYKMLLDEYAIEYDEKYL
jgi:hypothetical protein